MIHDPVLKAVCNHLHGAIRESRQTSAQAASVALGMAYQVGQATSSFDLQTTDTNPLTVGSFLRPTPSF